MGWRNLEIDRLMIDALIAHRYDAGDDQFNPPAWGPSNPEMPADTDVSGHPRHADRAQPDRDTAPC